MPRYSIARLDLTIEGRNLELGSIPFKICTENRGDVSRPDEKSTLNERNSFFSSKMRYFSKRFGPQQTAAIFDLGNTNYLI